MSEQPVDPTSSVAENSPPPAPGRMWLTWVVRVVAGAGVLVVAWACLTAWGAIVHGHPLYAALLATTLIGSACIGWRTLRPRPARSGWRRIIRIALVLASIVWIGLMAWLRPFTAAQPALAAMNSDAKVTVAEHPTQIVLTPTGATSHTGVFFQPGARVDARAYAAVLRPLAEAGFTVIIPKQPVGIAYLSAGSFDDTKRAHPAITRWVVGGHSLGGTIASMEADSGDTDPAAPVVGLLLYASYPVTDISHSLSAKVLSLSATDDGLATPDKVRASKAKLPTGSTFIAIHGAVHAFFGDYGSQPGDGTPTISHDNARNQISRDSVDFVRALNK